MNEVGPVAQTNRAVFYRIIRAIKPFTTIVHKVAFFTDLISVQRRMRPVTAFTYLKAPFGPFVTEISDLIDEAMAKSHVRRIPWLLGKGAWYRVNDRFAGSLALPDDESARLLNYVCSLVGLGVSTVALSEASHLLDMYNDAADWAVLSWDNLSEWDLKFNLEDCLKNPYDWKQSYEVWRDQELRAAIAAGERDVDTGRTQTDEEVREKMAP